MRLPCGCTIEDQYLPLQGGERYVECDHAAYVITGTRTTTTRFTSRQVERRTHLGH